MDISSWPRRLAVDFALHASQVLRWEAADKFAASRIPSRLCVGPSCC